MKTNKLQEKEFLQELKLLFKSVKDKEDLCNKFTDTFYSKKNDKEKKKIKGKGKEIIQHRQISFIRHEFLMIPVKDIFRFDCFTLKDIYL
mmetsp:Transcript_24477/g.36532  ORF Transcript_24477/g.36532 Transcript_24477/m.36532 type:complete len:90 (+) Transcript_24477:15-284(+)